MIANLEFSLRATAKATRNAEFGRQVASRTLRAAKRINAVQSKVQLPILEEVLAVFRSVRLKVNNEKELTSAANKIQQLGIRFAVETSGSDLEASKNFVPNEADWRWQ